MRGPALGSKQTQTKVCIVCGTRFFTQVGLDEHVRLVHELEEPPKPPRALPMVTPAGLDALRDRGRQIAALNNSRRRCCDACGLATTPAALGVHQKASGHTGWADAS